MRQPSYRVYQGGGYGDWYYELEGERSSRSYASRDGADRALARRLERLYELSSE